MPGPDLARFERHMVVRPTRPEDFESIIEIQRLCFPTMRPWYVHQLESQLAIFPEGQIVVELDGRVIASASSLIVEFEEYEERHNWKELTDDGMITNHDPEGSNLYGMEIIVHPDFQRMGLGQRLYDARKRLAEELNLKSIIIAGRMPEFENHADELTPKEYVAAVAQQRIYDPVLTFQMRQGFIVRRLLQDYLPRDVESKGNAVLLEWHNIEYQPPSRRALKTSHPVRICVIQYQMRAIESFDGFAAQCEYFVDVASNYSSDFAVFPELLTTQLLSCMDEKRPAEAMRALSRYTDQYIELFSDLAVRYNVNIIGGSHIVQDEDDERLYNVSFLFRRDGSIERQPKVHITPNEKRWWGLAAGDEIRVLDTDCGRIAINVCYDIEFPEMARIATDKGARIIFVPYCTEDRQGYLRVRYCSQARAVENQVYTVMAGTVGNLPLVENMDIQYGQSGIFTPSDYSFPRDGIAAECSPNVETVIVEDIDLEVLRRHRRQGSVRQLQERRHDLYQVRELIGETIVAKLEQQKDEPSDPPADAARTP